MESTIRVCEGGTVEVGEKEKEKKRKRKENVTLSGTQLVHWLMQESMFEIRRPPTPHA
jgi:hypothetical protein